MDVFNPWVRRMKYPFCIIAVVLFLPFVNDFFLYGENYLHLLLLFHLRFAVIDREYSVRCYVCGD